jgi:hypothetical protein
VAFGGRWPSVAFLILALSGKLAFSSPQRAPMRVIGKTNAAARSL